VPPVSGVREGPHRARTARIPVRRSTIERAWRRGAPPRVPRAPPAARGPAGGRNEARGYAEGPLASNAASL